MSAVSMPIPIKRQKQDHEIGSSFWGLCQLLQARLLDLAYLLSNEPLALHIAAHFGQRVGGIGSPSGVRR